MTAQPIRNALDRLLAQDRWELEHVTAGREALDALLERLQALEAALDMAGWYIECLERVQSRKVVRGLGEAKSGYAHAAARAALRKEGTP